MADSPPDVDTVLPVVGGLDCVLLELLLGLLLANGLALLWTQLIDNRTRIPFNQWVGGPATWIVGTLLFVVAWIVPAVVAAVLVTEVARWLELQLVPSTWVTGVFEWQFVAAGVLVPVLFGFGLRLASAPIFASPKAEPWQIGLCGYATWCDRLANQYWVRAHEDREKALVYRATGVEPSRALPQFYGMHAPVILDSRLRKHPNMSDVQKAAILDGERDANRVRYLAEHLGWTSFFNQMCQFYEKDPKGFTLTWLARTLLRHSRRLPEAIRQAGLSSEARRKICDEVCPPGTPDDPKHPERP